MVRDTSIEAYRAIEESGLLSQRRHQVYKTLFEYGPCTANELAKNFWKMEFKIPRNVNLNIVTRLGELRDLGVAKEVRTRQCSITGMNVIEWDVTSNLPIKFEKSKKIVCMHCGGLGYFMEQQAKLF